MGTRIIAALRGCRCTNNFEPGDLVQERRTQGIARHDGMVKSGRSQFKGHVIVEWHGVPDLFARMSVPKSDLRHRGACPAQIRIGMQVRITGSVLGLQEGDIGRVTGIAPSGIVTVQADSGDHTEAWRRNLLPLAS